MNERTGTLKFVCEVGALVRPKYRSFIKNLSFNLNLKLDMDEDWGLLESCFRIKLAGVESDLRKAQEIIEKLREYECENEAISD